VLPVLHEKDLRSTLDRLFERDPERRLFAFHGTGVEQELRLAKRTVYVRPVRSELELRAQMAALDAATNVAFLVPFEHEIPLDLRGRFGREGRVIGIGASQRLQRIFGATEIDWDARNDPLAVYLARHGADLQFPAKQGRLTRDELWGTWLRHVLGFDVASGLSLASLLAFIARDAKGPALLAERDIPGDAPLREAFAAYAESKLGPLGAQLVNAWAQGRGRAALELALLCEAVGEHTSSAANLWLRQQLKVELGVAEAAQGNAAIARLASEVGNTLFELYRGESPLERRKLYEAAEARVDEDLVRDAITASTRLPFAFRVRLERFGQALAHGVEKCDATAFEAAKLTYQQLERHELSKQEPGLASLRRADPALRLLAFLVVGSHAQLEPSLTAYGDAETLAGWYVREGGYVDWSRYQARGPKADAFGNGIAAVVEAVDALREALDVRFAKALAKWIEAGRPAHQLVPIDRALERVAAPFLEQYPERRLLVLLIDGMAWAQAAELLGEMSRVNAATGWAPLAWRGWAKGTAAHHPVMLAALPTITEVSRAAFFAGAMVPDGPREPTSKDVDRFAQHKALRKVCDGTGVPRLMLQGEAFGADGHLKQPARTMILDKSERVVGVVVNAIDDSLKGNPQVDRTWTLDKIRALADLLTLAREAGRTILFTSDHGHVPSDRMQRIGDIVGGGARWRPWKDAGDTVMAQELAFRGDGVFVAKGAHGVVLTIDDRARYGSQLHAGEHGGATLAEVVTPCLLLGCVLDDHGDDASTRVVAVEQPRWWHLEVRERVALVDEPVVTKPAKKKPAAANQLSLLGAESGATAAEGDGILWPFATPLLASALFDLKAPKGKVERDLVLKAVDFLLARHGVGSVDTFAAALGVLPFRIGGVIAQLQGVLNVDGYQVLSYDPQSKQVKLDAGKLGAQFGVVIGGRT